MKQFLFYVLNRVFLNFVVLVMVIWFCVFIVVILFILVFLFMIIRGCDLFKLDVNIVSNVIISVFVKRMLLLVYVQKVELKILMVFKYIFFKIGIFLFVFEMGNIFYFIVVIWIDNLFLFVNSIGCINGFKRFQFLIVLLW